MAKIAEKETAIITQEAFAGNSLDWKKAKSWITGDEIQVIAHPQFPQDYYIYGTKRTTGMRVLGSIRKEQVKLL